MKNFKILAVAVLLAASGSAMAAGKTVTLLVPGMSCPVCPVTVKKALKGVNGVNEVSVDFDSKKAVVSYDDTKADVHALQQATDNAGYPSSVVK
jgi:periplasmic mercuric ion binding protein